MNLFYIIPKKHEQMVCPELVPYDLSFPSHWILRTSSELGKVFVPHIFDQENCLARVGITVLKIFVFLAQGAKLWQKSESRLDSHRYREDRYEMSSSAFTFSLVCFSQKSVSGYCVHVH